MSMSVADYIWSYLILHLRSFKYFKGLNCIDLLAWYFDRYMYDGSVTKNLYFKNDQFSEKL